MFCATSSSVQFEPILSVKKRMRSPFFHRRLKSYWLQSLLLATFCCWLWFTPPVLASIHPYPEADGWFMWRSLQTLRDEADHAWQLVLFKRVKDGVVREMHLRLVGFPGAAELEHGRSLEIITPRDTLWTAPDVFTQTNLSPALAGNVGEYDVLQVVPNIESDRPLRLQLPLKNQQNLELTLPPFAVKEWRKLVDLLPIGTTQ
jgi:hypothetical protein